ncbi:MAG: hypothetical protein ACR2QF_03755 [Geminicoccaceae bacterium]
MIEDEHLTKYGGQTLKNIDKIFDLAASRKNSICKEIDNRFGNFTVCSALLMGLLIDGRVSR